MVSGHDIVRRVNHSAGNDRALPRGNEEELNWEIFLKKKKELLSSDENELLIVNGQI